MNELGTPLIAGLAQCASHHDSHHPSRPYFPNAIQDDTTTPYFTSIPLQRPPYQIQLKMKQTALTLNSTITLRDSNVRMPILGFGVYQIDAPHTTEACLRALSSGYRHIDTAQIYLNEEEVGAALQQSSLPREDIFVTTKIRYPRLGKGKTHLRALQSVQKIDRREDGYVDLFLIHSPHGLKPKERKELWLALEKFHAEGRAKAIGVSNYLPEHLDELKEYATFWPPGVNQILVSTVLHGDITWLGSEVD